MTSPSYFSAGLLIAHAVPSASEAKQQPSQAASSAADIFNQRFELGEVVADSSVLAARSNMLECHALAPGFYYLLPYSTGPAPPLPDSSSASSPSAADAAAAAAANAASGGDGDAQQQKLSGGALGSGLLQSHAYRERQPFVLKLHAQNTPIVAQYIQPDAQLFEEALFQSIKKHGLTVNCNVQGLYLYDWCAKKSAYFALEMTEDFVRATGKKEIIFTHELTLAENLFPTRGPKVRVRWLGSAHVTALSMKWINIAWDPVCRS